MAVLVQLVNTTLACIKRFNWSFNIIWAHALRSLVAKGIRFHVISHWLVAVLWYQFARNGSSPSVSDPILFIY